jgi:hypothetical protein
MRLTLTSKVTIITLPISVAFKSGGVDTLTQSGCIEYTMRGRLHWLGVLKDWDLQRKEPKPRSRHVLTLLAWLG